MVLCLSLMDLVGVPYVVSRSSACGVMPSARDVGRSLYMMKPDAPTPLGMAIELSIDDSEDREVRQAGPET